VPALTGRTPSRYTQKVPSGSSSVVEHRLAKARVAGSNPVSRSNQLRPWFNRATAQVGFIIAF
jgi:hypothetical protein